MTTKRLSVLGLLTAAALVLGYIEHIIPPFSALPGVKPGLANIVILFALYRLSARDAWLLMAAKVLLGGLMFAGLIGMMYGLAGGVLSLSAMLLIKKIPGVSSVGVSVAGAAFHNAGQLMLAALITNTPSLAGYLPVLLISAVITGLITGFISSLMISRVPGGITE